MQNYGIVRFTHEAYNYEYPPAGGYLNFYFCILIFVFNMIDTKKNFESNVIPYFTRTLGYKNPMAVPRIRKVTLNVGLGSLLKREGGGKDLMESVKQDITMISGQKPVETRAKKSIAAFGTRKGQVLGLKVTMRGKRMTEFLNRFINFVLPRTRDFSGISLTSFDGAGNLTVGIKEHISFPEIGTGKQAQKARRAMGLEIIISTTTQNKEEGIALFKGLGFPLMKE